MAIQGNPVVIIYGEVTEQIAAGSTAASAITETASVGTKAGTAFRAAGTGTAVSASVKASLSLTFVASTPQTIDLKAVPQLAGTKAFTIVHAIVIKDQGDATLAGSVVINNTGTNAWSNGPFSTVGETIAKGGEWAARNAQAAGWAVSTSNKVITLTPSAHVTTLSILIIGE